MVVNARKNLTLMSMQVKEESNLEDKMKVTKLDASHVSMCKDSSNVQQEVSLHENIYDSKDEVVLVVKDKYDGGTFSFSSVYLVLLFIFLVFSSVWLVAATMNAKVHENLINVLNDVSVVFIVVVMSQMYRFQAGWKNDTGQVR